jgi:pimeloyl-ACP methyl ester carboxylesterase
MPFPTIDRVSIGSTRIALHRHGRGPILLFIHGWPFNSAGWEPLADMLGEHFTCLMPDSPGVGESE